MTEVGGHEQGARAAAFAPRQVILTEEITRTYSLGEMDVHALQGINFTMEHGEFVAIMGPSGSGKSTMMHILGCLDRPTSGEYYLAGERVSALKDRDLADIRCHSIGFVFQQFNLLARTSALENVALPMLYSGIRPDYKRAMNALERVGLADRAKHKPNELSGGQQQRVAIARALVNEPELILADEPTGNLASQQSEEIMQVFQELNDAGITVIMVTHEPDVGQHAKRIVRFKDGRIVVDGPVTNRAVAKDVLEQMRD
ncbi:MAG TPA: ABC transporter ATP-binding protein [Armatimonadota bacterium]|jgi:putative ABC transport system ATP-binding protein